jgi:hypothetical protein
MADWLGRQQRPFKEARAFVRKLGLANQAEWFAYCKLDKKPIDIPATPARVYSADWINWSDWLGTKPYHRPNGGWRPFKQARAFVRKLSLKSNAEWAVYAKSSKRPDDIPATPMSVYSADWVNIFDWLGTKPLRPNGGWRPFKQARMFVRKLGLAGQKEWFAYCKSNKCPADIPTAPMRVYSADWIDWFDWLGGGLRKSGWRSFKEARAFVRKLGLTSGKQWETYCNSSKKPDDIPNGQVACMPTPGGLIYSIGLARSRFVPMVAGARLKKHAHLFASSASQIIKNGWLIVNQTRSRMIFRLTPRKRTAQIGSA